MIQGIAFTCYPVTDMARSRHFYETVLGLKPATDFGGHWQEYELGDNTFAIVVGSDEAPECFKGKVGIGLAFEVDDLEAAHAKMKEQNVPVVYGPGKFPSCGMFVITDPDENVITLHQLNKKAG